MSDDSRIRMIEAYEESRHSPPLFFTGFFGVTPRSFHDAEFIEYDVRRTEPYIAIPVPTIQSGARKRERTRHTNKRFEPPVYDTEVSISAWSQTKRKAGQNPFDDAGFRRDALAEAFEAMNDLEDEQNRAIEVMCSQTLQGGAVSLVDEANNLIYELDFGMKATHKITVSAAWALDGTTGDPLADIEAAGIVGRRDGKMRLTDAIFGTSAMARFLANPKVKARLESMGLQKLQDIAPEEMPDGVTYYGSIVIGHYRYRLWMYDDFYIHPVTGAPTPYVEDDKVILLAKRAKRVITYGSIPFFLEPDQQAAQFLPRRMSSVEGRFDFTTNVYITPDRKHLKMSLGSRPLPLPIAIDTVVVLDVVP